MQKYLTGVFAVSVGGAVCLTGIGIPLGVIMIGIGTWLIVTRDEKN